VPAGDPPIGRLVLLAAANPIEENLISIGRPKPRAVKTEVLIERQIDWLAAINGYRERFVVISLDILQVKDAVAPGREPWRFHIGGRD